MAAGNNRTVLTALFANAGIAIAKFVGFAITGSSSMLSEGVHSVADTSNQLLLLLGGQKAKRKANYDHPFGYGRERYFWSFVVAMILFSLGGLFSLYEGKHKIDNPTELASPGVALVILVIAMGLEGFAFMTAKAEAERMKGRNSWPAFIRRSKNPEIPVVLLEDAGAMIGLSIAFIGILLASFVNPIFDGIATILIGLLLLSIAIVLAVEMKSLLIGESASPENRDRLVASIEGHRDVVRLIDMRTQHLGPDQILVGAKVHYRDTLDTVQLAEAINQTELDMRSAVDERLTIYLEPDLFDSDQYVDELADDHEGDPFANFEASSESEESVVDRSSHDDRNSADGREQRREQPESFASAFGMEEAITTPTSGGEPAVDLAAVDEAARVRAEMASTKVATSVPLTSSDDPDDSTDPAASSDKPAGSSDKAAGSSDKPAGSSDRAAGGSDKPAGGSDKAAGSSDKSASGSDKPAGSSDKAAGSSDKPAGGSDRAAGGSDKAGGGSDKSARSGDTSASASDDDAATELDYEAELDDDYEADGLDAADLDGDYDPDDLDGDYGAEDLDRDDYDADDYDGDDSDAYDDEPRGRKATSRRPKISRRKKK